MIDNIRYAFNIYYYYSIATVSLNAIYYSYQGIKFIRYGNNLYYRLVSKSSDENEIIEGIDENEEYDMLDDIRLIDEINSEEINDETEKETKIDIKIDIREI